MTTDDMILIPRAELQQVWEVIERYKSLLVLVIDEDRLHGDVSQAIQALRERLAQPKYTTTSDTPEWRLISPEGKVYLGDSPLRCLRAEQDERIPPEVQIDNIRAAMEEAKAEPSAEPVAGEELPTDEMLLDLAANLIAGYLAEIPKNQQPYFADDAAGCVREINNRLTSSNVLSGDRLIPINVNGCTHTRTAAEWFALSQADYLRAQQPSEQAEPVAIVEPRILYDEGPYEDGLCILPLKGWSESSLKKGDKLYATPPTVAAALKPVAWRTFNGVDGYNYRDYDENENYAEKWAASHPLSRDWVDRLYLEPPTRTLADEDMARFIRAAEEWAEKNGYEKNLAVDYLLAYFGIKNGVGEKQ